MNLKSNKENAFEAKPKIVNIVATGRFPKKIDIVKLYNEIDFPSKEYEPETYPGLLVKVNVNGFLRHVTIYSNGKYIISGATSDEDVINTYETISKILKDYGYF
jgi:TATA-box binding protein (TBP) (component of TFIID and TFIIIB)